MRIQKSTTTYNLYFLLVLSTDGKAPATGKSPTVTLLKNGGAFGAPAGAVTEDANGWYHVAGNATDSNTLGPLLLHASEASSDNTDMQFEVVADDLTTAALRPATAGRTLVVDAAGLADANVVKLGPTGSGTAQTARDVGATLGAAGAGLTALGDARIANLDATISSRTKPADTQAAVTNLTNAPTVGDFTAAMKTSLNAATPASVVGAVGSVTGLTASDVGAIKTTIGVAGAGLTALGDTRLAHLDENVSTAATAILAAITALNNLSSAGAQAAAAAALTAYTAAAVGDIPTAAQNATALLAAAAAAPIAANVKKVNGVTLVGDGSATPWGPA